MSNYSKLKTIKQIISGSPKLPDILFSCKKYLAHTPNEYLSDHTDLTLKYLNALAEANKIDRIIDQLIEKIIPQKDKDIKEFVK